MSSATMVPAFARERIHYTSAKEFWVSGFFRSGGCWDEAAEQIIHIFNSNVFLQFKVLDTNELLCLSGLGAFLGDNKDS